MWRKPITIDIEAFPEEFRPLLRAGKLYDSSCSETARVIFIDHDGGYFLKFAPMGTLKREAELTTYFHKKHMAAKVVAYRSEKCDWLLTARVQGEDCTHRDYLAKPEQLCDTLAEVLRTLHGMDISDCPVHHTEQYLASAKQNFEAGYFDNTYSLDDRGYASAEEAWQMLEQNGHLLQSDTLLHGDFCLPNIMLDGWSFSGLIDLGNGGVGDKHVDLFWGAWSLAFNLKSGRFRERFFEAYGKNEIDFERLHIVAAAEVFG